MKCDTLIPRQLSLAQAHCRNSGRYPAPATWSLLELPSFPEIPTASLWRWRSTKVIELEFWCKKSSFQHIFFKYVFLFFFQHVFFETKMHSLITPGEQTCEIFHRFPHSPPALFFWKRLLRDVRSSSSVDHYGSKTWHIVPRMIWFGTMNASLRKKSPCILSGVLGVPAMLTDESCVYLPEDGW